MKSYYSGGGNRRKKKNRRRRKARKALSFVFSFGFHFRV
jgi:hypothetical protein